MTTNEQTTVTLEEALDLANLAAGTTLTIRARVGFVPDQSYERLPSGVWGVLFACDSDIEVEGVMKALQDDDYAAQRVDRHIVRATREPEPQDARVVELQTRLDEVAALEALVQGTDVARWFTNQHSYKALMAIFGDRRGELQRALEQTPDED